MHAVMGRKRQSHLAGLASKRRKLADGSCSHPVRADSDPEHVPEHVEACEPSGDDEEPCAVEEVSMASRRQEGAYRKRRSVERLRGLGSAAGAMWAHVVRTPSQKSLDKLGAEVARRACEAVVLVARMREERARLLAAKAAKAESNLRRKEQSQVETERRVCPRIGRTFAVEETSKEKLLEKFKEEFKEKFKEKLKGHVTSSRKLASRRLLTQDVVGKLHRIATKRSLLPCDVVGGEALARVELETLFDDQWELRKVYAMDTYVRLRAAGDGRTGRECYEEAARSVVTGKAGRQVNWQTVRRWVGTYVGLGGRIQPDGRGRHTSAESFLDDGDAKEKSREWLRLNVRSGQARTAGEMPLTTLHFWRWCNDTLLHDLLQANAARKPISLSTASRWLVKLGFLYRKHTKTIYFDGHEREDVVQDRMEKLVMLKVCSPPCSSCPQRMHHPIPSHPTPTHPTPTLPQVLEEVTVTFRGRDCEDTVWPLLHPGERPVVRVSQDESTFHANDDCPGEWCEKGRGMSIKKKSRGGFIMVSMFISELQGRVRCRQEQMRAYIALHPESHMAAKLKATPSWDGDSMLLLEPGAGKVDKWFDAEQLMEQTKLVSEVFEATHFAPGRWVYHPCATGSVSAASYPQAFAAVWLPPVPCEAQYFFDHSSGHGAYEANACVATRLHKGPDWKNTVVPMRDGYYTDASGVRQVQHMQFTEGDRLPCRVSCPPSIDPNAEPAAAVQACPVDGAALVGRRVLAARGYAVDDCVGKVKAVGGEPNSLLLEWPGTAYADCEAPISDVLSMLVGAVQPDEPEQEEATAAVLPPTEAELELAFKLYWQSQSAPLSKKHPGTPPAFRKQKAIDAWPFLPAVKRMTYVSRVRVKANTAPAQVHADTTRVFEAGALVPRVLWGRNKGLEVLLRERDLYPASGSLKSACENEKKHNLETNRCCCRRLLAVQPDFVAECSALQHMVEARVPLVRTCEPFAYRSNTVMVARHLCLFLPKVCAAASACITFHCACMVLSLSHTHTCTQFHCELNWIERYWGAAKVYTRNHCLYTLPGLRETVPLALSQDLSDVPPDTDPVASIFLQRRWARISRQYAREYLKGADACSAIKAVAAKRSSRHLDPNDRRAGRVEATMAAASGGI